MLRRFLAWLYSWLVGAALARPVGAPTDDEVSDLIRLVPCHFYTTVAGNGGGILIGGVVVAGVLTWEATPSPRNADITSSSSAGSQDSSTVVKGWKGTVTFNYDNDKSPSASGLTQGARVTLALQVGASGKTFGGAARLDGVGLKVDNQNGVVVGTCAFESVPPVWTDP